jgi:hypothetical protein
VDEGDPDRLVLLALGSTVLWVLAWLVIQLTSHVG